MPADGCDLFAQDCENGAACSWAGEGETMCWQASEVDDGEPCAYGFSCAAGSQCDFFSGSCYALCDPAGDDVEQCGREHVTERRRAAAERIGSRFQSRIP